MRKFRSDTFLWLYGQLKFLFLSNENRNTYQYICIFCRIAEDPARLRSTENSNRILVLKNLKSRLTKRNCSIMAGCLSKSKELLRLIPDLQCHNCKSVPGPNENQKNRYSCLNANASHILCEEHKTKCPCGSKVGNRLATN